VSTAIRVRVGAEVEALERRMSGEMLEAREVAAAREAAEVVEVALASL
jgi:hypothetical protein